MKAFTALMAVGLLILSLTPAYAADNAAATVNGQPIKQAWVDTISKETKEAGNNPDDKMILSELVRNELLSQEAIRLGIDKRPEYAAWQEIKRRELLSSLLIKGHSDKNPITEDKLKTEYEDFKARLGDKEYSARHIQLKTEQEAKDVIARLFKGEDFAKLAKEKSLDSTSKDKGGLLGWVAKATLKPPLGDTLDKLQKGLFNTVPLQTNAGWHVLKLEDVRDLKAPEFSKVKERLRQGLMAQQINKFVEELRAKSKIEIAK